MDYGIIDILGLLGSLGVFLYGMKLMSESLQKVAGDKMRSILAKMTSNRVMGVLTGVLVTAIIQSSSATTVMVVSFVNAGLLTLVESIGVIMGANIGTTITAWMISILGFKVSMSSIALPLIGIALPTLFMKNVKTKSWGELIMGFALLFIGLGYLKGAVPDIKGNADALAWLADFSNMGYLSYFFFMIVGTILTVVIQSSSATMALTLVMCSNGWIQYDMAAAMVLGENIGTTITANLAAMVANSNARRAARAHLIFNIFGVLWVLALLPFFSKWIAELSMNLGNIDPFKDAAGVPIALSLFHTVFNVTNTLLMLFFVNFIGNIVTKLVKDNEAEDEVFSLQYIKFGLMATSEMAIYQARQEISLFGNRVSKMFDRSIKLSKEESTKKFDKIYSKIEKNEDSCDNLEIEIANYLTKLSENQLTAMESGGVTSSFKIIDNLESIGDAVMNIAKYFYKAKTQKIEFTDKLKGNIAEMDLLVSSALDIMQQNLDASTPDLEAAEAAELKINDMRKKLKLQNIKAIENGDYSYNTGIFYTDIISECEKIGDYVINVSESLDGNS